MILSSLLGSYPPSLPRQALISFAELFDIRPGTSRTALSRMVANGELVTNDGGFELAGRLLGRQFEQDSGQSVNETTWSGDWVTAVAMGDRRSMSERRSFRESMIGSRLAELRPDIWMRPANTVQPPRPSGVLITTGPLDCDDVEDLVRRLWNLEEINATAQQLAEALERQLPAVHSGDVAHIPHTFMVSAAVVRFLRIEPQLPAGLAPNDWTAATLRPMYNEFNAAFRPQLREFFASASEPA